MAETEDYTLEIDCNHLYVYKPSLYKQLEDYPADVIPIFDLVALQVYKDLHMNYDENMGDPMDDENDQII